MNFCISQEIFPGIIKFVLVVFCILTNIFPLRMDYLNMTIMLYELKKIYFIFTINFHTKNKLMNVHFKQIIVILN